MTEHEVVDIFTADAPPDLAVRPDPAEVAEVRWIGIYDLAAEAKRHPERFTPWLKIYLDEHLAGIFGKRIAI
jgi:isopentenyl-diphosphate delta-isomerase